VTAPQDRIEVTLPEVRELATEWARQLDTLAAEMYAFLAARIPEARADDEIAGLTLASCSSNVEAVLSMIRHGIPASATEAPVAALEHARQMAARGASIDATLRFYRLGHAFFWERLSAGLVEAVADRDRLMTALSEVSAFIFAYIDAVSARVSAELIAERERRQRRAAALRADVVRAVLAGEPADAATAERTLGHPLSAPQLAFVCWTAGEHTMLERAAAAVAQELGARRPLLLPEGADAVACWVIPRDAGSADSGGPAGGGRGGLVRGELGGAVQGHSGGLARRAATVAPDVHVAFGALGHGLDGFRASRQQADRARRVVELAGRQPPTLTWYPDVAVVDLLSRDLPAARAFVEAQLGPLAARDDSAARLRAALLAVIAPSGGLAAAARELGVHRNTVLQRLHRAEELLGRPVAEGAADLYAALLLAETVPEAVLAHD